MNEQATQTEIKAIQERLQAMRAGHQAPRPPATAPMVEMFPSRFAPVNLARDTASRNAELEDSTTRPGHDLESEWRPPSRADHEGRSSTVTPDLHHSLTTSQSSQSQMTQPSRAAAPTGLGKSTGATNFRADSRTAESRPADFRNTSSRPAPATASLLQQQEGLQQLEAKAQQINQLSAAQETAMLELKAIATRLERDWTALELQQGDAYTQDGSFPVPPPAICEYLATTVPAIERDESGAFVITSRAVDLFKAERDAEVMAQTLRHRTGTSTTRRRRAAQPSASMRMAAGLNRLLQSLWTQVQAIASLVTAQSSADSTRRPQMDQNYARRCADNYAQNTEPDTLSYKASALWLGGAVIARIAADLFLASHPGFWLPVMALMVAPAAIAIYRTTVAPQSSVVWGYRLFLIMIGLLLGGRLL